MVDVILYGLSVPCWAFLAYASIRKHDYPLAVVDAFLTLASLIWTIRHYTGRG